MARGNKTGGRAIGTPNKITTEARQAIALFVEQNAHRLTGWLDEVAEENPAKAFELFQSVVEYHIPKLARTELTGDEDNPVALSVIERVIVKANDSNP